jgi:peroxiredoxin
MQCRAHATQLGRLAKDFQSANTEVLVILGDTLDRARQYAGALKLPFPVLADPDRQVYERFGLDKAFIVIQRTASVIVDQAGVIRYLRRTANPMTWLQESRELLEVVQGFTEAKSQGAAHAQAA